MSDEFTYFDKADPAPEPWRIAFTEDETRRVVEMAEWWALMCKRAGIDPPPDPMHAMLQACEHMHSWLSEIDRAAIMAGRDAHNVTMQ